MASSSSQKKEKNAGKYQNPVRNPWDFHNFFFQILSTFLFRKVWVQAAFRRESQHRQTSKDTLPQWQGQWINHQNKYTKMWNLLFPKNPDPSKIAIFWGPQNTPAAQLQTLPRIQGFLGLCMVFVCFWEPVKTFSCWHSWMSQEVRINGWANGLFHPLIIRRANCWFGGQTKGPNISQKNNLQDQSLGVAGWFQGSRFPSQDFAVSSLFSGCLAISRW